MKLKHKLIPIDQTHEWEAAISGIPHSYCHAHWYNLAMKVASQRDVYLYLGETEAFRVICPLSPRQIASGANHDITTPYGFSGFASIGNHESFASEWSEFLRSQQFVCGHIALHPLLSQDATLYETHELFFGKKTYYIDLSQSLDAIYQQFSDDHRHRLRQWQKKNFTIHTSKDKKYIDAFIKNYTSSLKARNAASIYDFGDEAWNLILASPHTQLFSVLVDDQIEASAVFILYQDIADYFMIASTDTGRHHARGIVWEAIQQCHHQGLRWLHLGCGVNDDDALEQFKMRFGGAPIHTKALKQIYDKHAYIALCEKYATDPTDLKGYFPSYWGTKRKDKEEIA
jgi:hypothetical protein